MVFSAAPATAGADGAELYQEYCASCHGADLKGQTPDWRQPNDDGTLPAPPHDDSGHTWHHSDAMLRDYVYFGGAETLARMGVTGIESGMPAFRGALTEAEIEAVLDFIKSSWSPRMRDYQKQVTETSE